MDVGLKFRRHTLFRRIQAADQDSNVIELESVSMGVLISDADPYEL